VIGRSSLRVLQRHSLCTTLFQYALHPPSAPGLRLTALSSQQHCRVQTIGFASCCGVVLWRILRWRASNDAAVSIVRSYEEDRNLRFVVSKRRKFGRPIIRL